MSNTPRIFFLHSPLTCTVRHNTLVPQLLHGTVVARPGQLAYIGMYNTRLPWVVRRRLCAVFVVSYKYIIYTRIDVAKYYTIAYIRLKRGQKR